MQLTSKYTFCDGQVETVLSLSSALTEARALSYSIALTKVRALLLSSSSILAEARALSHSIALTEVRALCRCCRPLLPRQELCPIQLLLPRYEHCVVVVICLNQGKSFCPFQLL